MRMNFGWCAAAVVLYGLQQAGAQEAQVIEVQVQAQAEGGQAQAQGEAGGAPKVRVLQAPSAGGGFGIAGLPALPPMVGESQFAIGIALEPLPEALKAQLGLARGLVVANVFEKSPAEAAGIQKNDLLLSAGGADVKSPADVVAAVGKAEMNPLSLTLLRGGKEIKVEVKPDAKTRFRIAVPGGGELDVLTRQFEKALPPGAPHAAWVMDGGGGNVIRLHPGVMTGRLKLDSLPAGVKLQLTKEGDQPAKIVVEKGEAKWEGAEDKLDEAPEELKAIARKALGREGRIELGVEAVPYPKFTAPVPVPPGVPAVPNAAHAAQLERAQAELRRKIAEVDQGIASGIVRRTVVAPPVAADGRVEAKLDAVLKKLGELEEGRAEKLQRQLDELREQVELLKKK